jgi:hypothetical protein
MLIKSGLLTQMSGSMGGMTGSHNSAGMYLRGRGLVTNPNTEYQQYARNALATLVTAWGQTLTQTQRDAWNTYAANTPTTGKLGDPLLLSGQQMYIRCNAPRLNAGEPRVDDGPTTFGMANLTSPSISAAASGSVVAVSFDNGDDWATVDDGALLVQLSRQMAPTINFFKGPFRYAGEVQGDTMTPPTSPANVGSPFGDVFTAGNKVVARIVASNADGRLSPVAIVSAVIA